MKSLLVTFSILSLLLALTSCSSSQNKTFDDPSESVTANDTILIANDSLEYEVIIIEPGFYGWLATQPPKGYRSQSSMDIRNDQKIPIYNLRVNQPMIYDPDLYPFPIDYDPRIDYGYEVTYLLFNYFLFFEERYNQRL